MQTQRKARLHTLVTAAVMVALATALALATAQIPFLNLPFGGGFTIASMLPIVLVSYMYGTRAGLLTAFAYSLVQILLGAFTGGGYVLSLFTVGSDDFMGVGAGIAVLFIDYILAYTLIGFGGIFRKSENKTKSLILGTVVGLSFRYLAHILSGVIFFGVWAERFFGQEGFPGGEWILSHISGGALSLLYAVVYNGLFMIPEILITAVCAAVVSRVPEIKRQ